MSNQRHNNTRTRVSVNPEDRNSSSTANALVPYGGSGTSNALVHRRPTTNTSTASQAMVPWRSEDRQVAASRPSNEHQRTSSGSLFLYNERPERRRLSYEASASPPDTTYGSSSLNTGASRYDARLQNLPRQIPQPRQRAGGGSRFVYNERPERRPRPVSTYEPGSSYESSRPSYEQPGRLVESRRSSVTSGPLVVRPACEAGSYSGSTHSPSPRTIYISFSGSEPMPCPPPIPGHPPLPNFGAGHRHGMVPNHNPAIPCSDPCCCCHCCCCNGCCGG